MLKRKPVFFYPKRVESTRGRFRSLARSILSVQSAIRPTARGGGVARLAKGTQRAVVALHGGRKLLLLDAKQNTDGARPPPEEAR